MTTSLIDFQHILTPFCSTFDSFRTACDVCTMQCTPYEEHLC